MKQFSLFLSGLLLAATPAIAAPAKTFSPQPLQWTPKAHAHAMFKNNEDAAASIRMRAQAKQTTLPTSDEIGFLDGPNGENWYFTATFTRDYVEHELWTEDFLTGFKFSIYDSDFNVITTIEDTVTLAEGETKIQQIQLGAAVTRKFFNTNDKCEFMVMIVANTADYVNHVYTNVYTEGGPEAIDVIDGYYIDAVNARLDQWSEDFYITFMTEQDSETPEINGQFNPADYVFSTYKKTFWSGGPQLIKDFRIPMLLLGSPDSMPFLSTPRGSEVYFSINHLKYCFFEEPYNYENENLTPDNQFIIKTWKYDRYNLTQVTDIEIPTENEGSEYAPFRYYNIGLFLGGNDVSFGVYDDSDLPCYLVTEQVYKSAGDDFTNDYVVYDGKGEKIFLIADNVDTVVYLSDIDKEAPQAAFVINASSSPVFNFIDYRSGKLVASFPYAVAEGVYLNDSIDRVSDGKGGYLYVVSQYMADADDEGNAIHCIAYLKPDGTVDHLDKLNLGKNVDYAECYIAAAALDPYLFNTDDLREYMVLLKRRISQSSSLSQEELIVINEYSEELLHITPSEEYGDIINIRVNPADRRNDACLMVIYRDQNEKSDFQYTARAYELPLSTFANGLGTADDPYQIATYGEFRQIGKDMDAHYVLTADINAGKAPLNTFAGAFKGTLDGRGHSVRNLRIEGEGLFAEIACMSENDNPESLKGGEVRNITFLFPEITADGAAGVVAASAMGAQVSNVHVFNGVVEGSGDEDLGGLIGEATYYTKISDSSFDGSVSNPKGSAGGIAGITYTGTSIANCAVSGHVEGAQGVGGIVGNFQDNLSSISDCHVNADIKGFNTVGGVAGYSKRGLIQRCHVQGKVAATSPSRWDNFTKTGGVVGELWADWQNRDSEDNPIVIRDCFVNLSALSSFVPEDEAALTTHRIVGYTSINDGDDDWEGYREDYLYNNYAISTLEPVDAALVGADETEGASIDAADVNLAFFADTLGFRFGDSPEAPWSDAKPSAPTLYFEKSILIADPDFIEIVLDEKDVVRFTVLGVDNVDENTLAEAVCAVGDEEIVSVEGIGYEANGVVVTVKAQRVGTTTLTVTLDGKEATATISVKWPTGIDTAETDGEAVYYDLSGRRVATPEKGLYIRVANGQARKVMIR